MDILSVALPTEAPRVMGVLNATPDSFSDGGRHLEVDAAVARVAQMIDEGATVIDIGGESTRPGAEPVPFDIETRRVLPVIEAIVDTCRDAGTRISIDTRHEPTARAAVAAGADLINDVSASLWPVAADLGVGWVAMHMLGDPRTMQRDPHYDDVVDEVRGFLVERAEAAARAGVDEVWVDPGIGFGKSLGHNIALLARLDELVDEGFPVAVATSRKRSMGVMAARSDAGLAAGGGAGPGGLGRRSGSATDPEVEPVGVEDRVEASLATATWAMILGAKMIRSHDVAMTVQAASLISGANSSASGHP